MKPYQRNLRKMPSPKKYKILDLAENQLRTAIMLFLTGQDLVSAITLAGASDVLLCQLIKDQGKENFTDHILKHENNPKKTIQEIGKEVNDMFCINALKHMDSIDDNDVTMNLHENAVGAILKALPNYIELKGADQDFVKGFIFWIRSNLDHEKYNVNCDPNRTSKV